LVPINRPVKPKLKVVPAGKAHFIEVPTSAAGDLLGYLRRHGVRAAPPEPCFSGMDRIELARGADPEAIQGLLDRWV
jgi:hypothetical protein